MKYSSFKRIIKKILEHKIISAVVMILIVGGIYLTYSKVSGSSSTNQYTLQAAKIGTITETVTGSGQISASYQTDITSKVSGTIESINVKVGQPVKKGEVIAKIDSTDAAIELENAELSYKKLVAPPKATDLSNAQNTLYKTYNDGFNSASTIYIALPSIMTGLKDMFYDKDGFLSDQKSYLLGNIARTYRNTAANKFDTAFSLYEKNVILFNSLSRTSSTSSIESMIASTKTMMAKIAEATSETQNAVTFITTNQSEYKSSDAASAKTDTDAWATEVNSQLSSIISSSNGIETAKNSLYSLINSADELDVQSALLSLKQKQDSYSDYYIRAPYDGIIGRIPVSVYGQASGSTVIATIIGQEKLANISLNEVDAAKVSVGQKVQITFDAIDNLNATGVVSSVDQIGTVSSGVVSYGVKIVIDSTDPRIKPGMSVNTTIIINEKNNVIVIPTTAIKKQNKKTYVQVIDRSLINARLQASSTANRNTTVTTDASPAQVTVTIGTADDTNTEITSGLKVGDMVITKTSAVTSTDSSTAPSILNSLGRPRQSTTRQAVPMMPR